MANEPQPMPPELYREVRALFDRALDRPEPERRAFVEAACKGRPEVLAEVRRLLDARGRAHTFLEDGPGRVQTVGRYVIVGELGRGTMGTVYDAIDPLIERRIALKVIRCDALAADTEAGSSRERLLR